MKKAEVNLAVLQNFILHITHCSGDNELDYTKPMSFTPEQLYQMAQDYIEEDHVDGKENPDMILRLDWICTDPDNHQYGCQIADGVYMFKEWDQLNYTSSGTCNSDKFKDDNFDNPQYWTQLLVEPSKYSTEEQEHIINAYGYTLKGKDGRDPHLQNIKYLYPKNWRWIIAECIFESESGLY